MYFLLDKDWLLEYYGNIPKSISLMSCNYFAIYMIQYFKYLISLGDSLAVLCVMTTGGQSYVNPVVADTCFLMDVSGRADFPLQKTLATFLINHEKVLFVFCMYGNAWFPDDSFGVALAYFLTRSRHTFLKWPNYPGSWFFWQNSACRANLIDVEIRYEFSLWIQFQTISYRWR